MSIGEPRLLKGQVFAMVFLNLVNRLFRRVSRYVFPCNLRKHTNLHAFRRNCIDSDLFLPKFLGK